MRPRVLVTAVAAVFMSSLLFLSSFGCGSSNGRGGAAPRPDGGYDIRGYVSSVWGISADPRPGGVLGSILVEGELEEDTRYDRASVTITDDTGIFTESGGELVRAGFGDLAAGQLVQATFTGPVAESYPVQATASEVIILGHNGIAAVMDRREAELMSIDGVVGFGISSRDGEPVIVVYLVDDTPGLKARVPTELEGYKVVTEVTGPIEVQPL